MVYFLLPAIPQPQSYHDFVDIRAFGDIPNFANVFSNLAFFLTGFYGLFVSRRAWGVGEKSNMTGQVFFASLLLVTLASGAYHWTPADGSLLFDRLAIALAFASLLSLVLEKSLIDRHRPYLLPLFLLLGMVCVLSWPLTGELRIYLLFQGVVFLTLLILLFLFLKDTGMKRGLTLTLIFYALAFMAEKLDFPLFLASGELISGHSLKHLLAGIAPLFLVKPVFVSAPEGESQSV